MTNFLPVKEAAALVGRSPSSIRRVIIYPIIEATDHPDRVHIWPGVDEVAALRLKGESFPWKLTEELLRRMVPVEPVPDRKENSARPNSSTAEGELLAMLRGELAIKNQQIAQQAELISKQADLVSGLSERLREGNVLMAALQQRLALPDGRNDDKPVDAVVSKSPTTKTRSEATAKSDKPEKGSAASVKPSKPKKRFLFRLFS
jgi:hypothetical protein